MNVVLNTKSIERNKKIGQYTSLGSLVVLGTGMYVSFTQPEWVVFSFICLLVGFIGSQVGIYFGNRWGRRPRIDETLTASLKGLTREYSLYHYVTPAPHLLIGPAGVWIISPYYQRGKIVYEKGRWKQKGGGFLLAYLKAFAQEGLGRPDLEVKGDIDNIRNAMQKALGDENVPEPKALMVFLDDRAELEPNDSPYPMLRPKELKEFFRKAAKTTPLPASEIKRIAEILPEGEEA